MGRYTCQQWLTLISFAVANLGCAGCISLQAPFYPKLAESRGVTPTQYGFVFGIYQLTIFLTCPIYGNFIDILGAKFMVTAGIFISGSTCILFGFLDRVGDTTPFLVLSFAIRIIEAMGTASFYTASFGIIGKLFPEQIGTTFSALETFFGVGLIAGPAVGGVLFEVGGYMFPFVIQGSLLILAAAFTACVMPTFSSESDDENESRESMMSLLKVPAITLAAFATFSASVSTGFLQATLEPHLRPLGLSSVYLGLMFVITGGIYGLFSPVWGWLGDKLISPRIIILLGGLLCMISFMILGPAPFLPIPASLPLCVLALVVQGMGFGAELVASFVFANKAAVSHGLPEDISTYGRVSGMVGSSFALGAFVGPSAGGALFDDVGFRWATMFVSVLHLVVAVAFGLYMCCTRKKHKNLAIYYKVHDSLAQHDDERTALTAGNKTSFTFCVSDSSLNDSIRETSGEYHVY